MPDRRLRGLGPRHLGRVLALCAAALATPPGLAAQGGSPVASTVRSDLAPSDRRLLEALPGAQVGFVVVDPATGVVLRSHQADAHFVPASNQKILTTAAALEALGPDHRFRTSLWATGPVLDGHLAGDLVVRPSGDPTMSRRFHPGLGSAVPLGELARQLSGAGITQVSGRLVVDATAWDSTTVEETWMTGDLPYGYAALGGAFVVDEGVFEVVVSGTGEAPQAEVEVFPRRRRKRVRGHALVVPAGDSARLRLDRLSEDRWLLNGTQGAVDVDTLTRSTGEPVLEAGRALEAALQTEGIAVLGGLQVAWPGDPRWAACPEMDPTRCSGSRQLAEVTSPPLIEVVAAILEPSQNWIAEQVIRLLGAQADGGRPSWEYGPDAAEAILAGGFGVDPTTLDIRDGSGLSAYNLVTPGALARILVGIAARPWAAAYRDALAEPGEVESTLERRLEPLAGRLSAKTGTITHVNALSGYVVTDGGRELVFSLLTNVSGLESWRVRQAMDEWLLEVARER